MMPIDRSPAYVVRDLMMKAGKDVGDASLRIMALVEHPDDKLEIATAALAVVMSHAGVMAAIAMPGLRPEQAIDAMLQAILPIVHKTIDREYSAILKAIGGSHA